MFSIWNLCEMCTPGCQKIHRRVSHWRYFATKRLPRYRGKQLATEYSGQCALQTLHAEGAVSAEVAGPENATYASGRTGCCKAAGELSKRPQCSLFLQVNRSNNRWSCTPKRKPNLHPARRGPLRPVGPSVPKGLPRFAAEARQTTLIYF